jgi:SRSO17 transposase
VPLAVLVKVAERRWCVEECLQADKNETGLDHSQVRLYKAWYRYVTLAMLALAWLAVTRAPSQTAATNS